MAPTPVTLKAAITGELLGVAVIRVHKGFLQVLRHLKLLKHSITGRNYKEGDVLLVAMPLESYIEEIPLSSNTKSTAVRDSWRGWATEHVDDAHIGTMRQITQILGEDIVTNMGAWKALDEDAREKWKGCVEASIGTEPNDVSKEVKKLKAKKARDALAFALKDPDVSMFNPSSRNYTKPENLGFEADPDVHALSLVTIQNFLASYIKDNDEMTKLLMLSEDEWAAASKETADRLKSQADDEDDEDDEEQQPKKGKAKGRGAKGKGKKRAPGSDDDGDDSDAEEDVKPKVKSAGKASKAKANPKSSAKAKGKKRAAESDSSSSSDLEVLAPLRKKQRKGPLLPSSAHNSDAA